MLSKARARALSTCPCTRATFTEVVRRCRQAGLVRDDVLYVDSTLVKANAGLGSAGARALLAQLPSAPGTSRRCGGKESVSIRIWRPPARGSGAGLGRWPHGERGGAPSLHVAGPEGRANEGTRGGERLGDQSHRSRRGAGQARGSTPSITGRTSAWTAGGARHHRAGRDRARLPTSTCWTACSRSIEARPGVPGGRSGGGYQVRDPHANYVALEQQGIRASIRPQHHERPG